MSNRKKIIDRVLYVDRKSIHFAEFAKCLIALGFEHDRTAGSHQIWKHQAKNLTINIQPKGKMAKPYQIREFRTLWKEFGDEH